MYGDLLDFKGACGLVRVKNCSFENIWLKHGVLGASFYSSLIWDSLALATSSQLLPSSALCQMLCQGLETEVWNPHA